MLNWFRAHMAAHPAKCRLAIWHHPRWISGDARADEDVRVHELYNVSAYQGRISLILNGHSHSCQRFTSMLADGRIDLAYRAPRSITVGTGGAQLVPFTAPARTGTRFRTASHHGVLRVRLDPAAGPASSTLPTAPSWTGPAPAARGASGRPGARSSTMGA
jgi:hypothetical protein